MSKNVEITGVEILGKIGEGGQGEVFRVLDRGTEYALKLYTENNSTAEQRKMIQTVIETGVPAKHLAHRFAWPLKLVETKDGKRFGYLMPLIDTDEYVELTQIESGRIRHPGYGIMIEAGRQLAECFRELHIAGFCYRDISNNNVLFNLKTGDVMIFDNDNIVIDKQEIGNVQGTSGYMAPEVTLGKRPSTVTDQYSLAVLLFILLCGGHPLHGQAEAAVKIFDGIAARHLYGENPVFVFDPNDRSNRLPDEDGYRHVAARWRVLPSHIRSLFLKSFTSGLDHPESRVTDMTWKNALSSMLEQRHLCTCGAENFWDQDADRKQTCWHCGNTVQFPAKLHVQGKESTALLIQPGLKMTSVHFGEKSSSTIIAEIEAHPKAADQCLLRNRTGETWNALLGKQQVEVPAGRAVPLHPGLRIQTAQHELVVHA